MQLKKDAPWHRRAQAAQTAQDVTVGAILFASLAGPPLKATESGEQKCSPKPAQRSPNTKSRWPGSAKCSPTISEVFPTDLSTVADTIGLSDLSSDEDDRGFETLHESGDSSNEADHSEDGLGRGEHYPKASDHVYHEATDEWIPKGKNLPSPSEEAGWRVVGTRICGVFKEVAESLTDQELEEMTPAGERLAQQKELSMGIHANWTKVGTRIGGLLRAIGEDSDSPEPSPPSS